MNVCIALLVVVGANPADQPAETVLAEPAAFVDLFSETGDADQGNIDNVIYDGSGSGQDGNSCQSGGCDSCEVEKYHCWDSTYDMPQHYPYPPAYHGYYYYRPYNYGSVLNHRDNLLGDTRIAPYFSTVFEHLYAEFPKEPYNPSPAEIRSDRLIPPAAAKLPNLQDLLKAGSDG